MELGDRTAKLPSLKDTENSPIDVPAANVSILGFEMYTLLMRVVSGKITDENICLHNKVQTNIKKLV